MPCLLVRLRTSTASSATCRVELRAALPGPSKQPLQQGELQQASKTPQQATHPASGASKNKATVEETQANAIANRALLTAAPVCCPHRRVEDYPGPTALHTTPPPTTGSKEEATHAMPFGAPVCCPHMRVEDYPGPSALHTTPPPTTGSKEEATQPATGSEEATHAMPFGAPVRCPHPRVEDYPGPTALHEDDPYATPP